ncbi:MAG: DUF1285 domain-containing protein [Porphyrobacter sp.]|nr:DUF1285 domain-containing protein [Porphyrobacter sp.]
MPYVEPPDLAAMSLREIADVIEAHELPPVDRWNPKDTADSHARIAADGTWFHEGREITRPAMIRTFSSLLKRDRKGRHWLVTPECKQSIEVEDAAFIAIDTKVLDGALAFRLNTDELVIAGPNHPLRSAGDLDKPSVYLMVRHGCEAKLNRSTWLQLAHHAMANDDGFWVESQGERFSLYPE